MRAIRPRVVGLLVAAIWACAGNTAPREFLVSPSRGQTDAFGGWIELEYLRDGRTEHLDGELLAVRADSVWVLGPSGAIVLATAPVRRGKLTAYHAQAGQVAALTGLGVVSTISNGLFLVFTAPMWIVVGSVTAGSQSREPVSEAPPLPWADLSLFARFPQGVPAALDLSELEPKRQPRQR